MEIWITLPFYLLLFIGLIITAIGLFGNAIIFVSTLVYAFLTGFYPLGIKELIIIGSLYALGELLEYVFTLLGVKWLGASRIAGWMAVLGTLFGAIYGSMLLWGIGVIIGGFLGAIIGAFLTELIIKGHFISALKAGIGAFVGKVGAIFAKLSIAIIIIIYILKVMYYF